MDYPVHSWGQPSQDGHNSVQTSYLDRLINQRYGWCSLSRPIIDKIYKMMLPNIVNQASVATSFTTTRHGYLLTTDRQAALSTSSSVVFHTRDIAHSGLVISIGQKYTFLVWKSVDYSYFNLTVMGSNTTTVVPHDLNLVPLHLRVYLAAGYGTYSYTYRVAKRNATRKREGN